MKEKRRAATARLRRRAAEAAAEIPAILLALGQRETPLRAKLFAGLAIAYALSPVDLIPDFIPVLGYLDDLVILPLLIGAAVRSIPPEILAACREAAAAQEGGEPRKRWYFAVPAVTLWLALAYLILRAILR